MYPISGVICLISLTFHICNGLSASFYGNSFIHIPLEDASEKTEIQLQFRTHRPDGLLLLAAGDTDYCVIELKAGVVTLRVDLGSGEGTVRSPPGLVFNDLRWHTVQVNRTQSLTELRVDQIHITSIETPGRFFELNINTGVFLGGIRAQSDMFFGIFKQYRGCLEEVTFNQVNILQEAEKLNDPFNRRSVTWGCSSEFRATSSLPISFKANTSYVAFPSLHTRRSLISITFDLRTRTDNALLVYHSGRSHNSDFLVLEILNSQVSLKVNKGNGAIEFVSRKNITDGVWHQVEVVIDPINIRLGVDGVRKERRTNFGENKFLDLDGYLFVGGLDTETRERARDYLFPSMRQSHSGGGSYVGCLQNFKVNGELHGFREAEISHGLTPECLWSFPCTNRPCVEGADCMEKGYYHYDCICAYANCYRTDALDIDSPSYAVSNIVHSQDVVVREGESTPITTSNIDLLVDYGVHGIQVASVIYMVVTPPEFGNIKVSTLDNDESMSNVTFSQDDLIKGRISYVHDGSEAYSDSIGLILEFHLNKGINLNRLPAKFRQTYGFTLMIQVAEWNDRPVLHLPDGNTLTLVEETNLLLTPDIIKAEDRDDIPKNLEFTIQYQEGYDIGYFQLNDTLGIRARVTRFTQEDINKMRVTFAHRGALVQNFGIQVSDGKDSIEPQLLRIEAVELMLVLEANTGLHTYAYQTTLLTKQNLSYTTNAQESIRLRYEIKDPTYSGDMEKRRFGEKEIWDVTTSFTQNDIDEGRIRYRQLPELPPENDFFRYRVIAKDLVTDWYEFQIMVTPIRVDVLSNFMLELEGMKQGMIGQEYLEAMSTVKEHTTDQIVFNIMHAPSYGDLLIFDEETRSKIRLGEGSNFTQSDINGNKVYYRKHRTSTQRQEDHFQFRVIIPGDDTTVDMFDIIYVPLPSEEKFTNNLLTGVLEGDTQVITENDLFIETTEHTEFSYSIIHAPMHGAMQLMNLETGLIDHANVSSFTNKDIKLRKLYYRHDDSETTEDSFDFVAVPEEDPDEEEEHGGVMLKEFSGTFDISIELVNDNVPHRVTDRVFDVVVDRGRVVTFNDIQFDDEDREYDTLDLLYSWPDIQNGKFVDAEDHDVELDSFTQRDLKEGKVFFVHSGARYKRSVLWVTDGENSVHTLFEVRASDPFLVITNNTGLSLRKGKSVCIYPNNLSINTNLDVTPDSIKIMIVAAPKHGQIRKHDTQKNRFNMLDIKSERIFYHHDNSNFIDDSFRFNAKTEKLQVQGVVLIDVLTEDDMKPPTIINNEVVIVEENGREILSRHNLKTVHPEYSDSEIIYTISKHPSHGQLTFKKSDGREVQQFSQEDINKKRLQYHNNEPGYATDELVFDVSNGITALTNLRLVFEIEPVIIPVMISNFTVAESQRHVISTDVIRVKNRRLVDEGLEYVVVHEPSSGWIENKDRPQVRLFQFSHSQVINEQIYYEHDGNETIRDSFTVMVKSSDGTKQSNPQRVGITIIPTNDQPPKVVVNNDLHVWVGSTTNITQDHLRAEDLDSPPEQLMYVIWEVTNGRVVLADAMERKIENFTQAHLNMGKVLFIHVGEMEGQFSFQVNDGPNRDSIRTFRIHAQALELHHKARVLEVFPGVLQPITRKHMYAYTNDEWQTNPILYTLQKKPEMGVLVTKAHDNEDLMEVQSFTQQEIDDGLISYRHVSAMNDWEQHDHFIYEITTQYASGIFFEMFAITISYENLNTENELQVLEIQPVQVEEDGDVGITLSHLNPAKLKKRLEQGALQNPVINFVISDPPQHGWLEIGGENASVETRFTERDLQGGHVKYYNDGSENLWDGFYFGIEIVHIEGGEPVAVACKSYTPFNVTIFPVNDQEPIVVHLYPYIELVQGYTKTITRDVLLTEDKDTPPEELVYNVADGPDNGYLILTNNTRKAVKTFTQRDIDMEKLVFVSDGSMDSGAFYFSISDGKFDAIFKTFIIRVFPLTLELRGVSTLHLTQGHFSVVFKAEDFNVRTNGRLDYVTFNITGSPRFGQIFVNNNPSEQFSYMDLKMGKVVYIQTSSQEFKDEFEFKLYDMQNIITDRKMAIRVLPLVKRTAMEPFRAFPGESTTISVDYLDASQLADQTGSIPMYIIIKPPERGEIVKLVEHTFPDMRLKRRIDRQPMIALTQVSNFSHKDIVDEKVKYRAIDSDSTVEGIDSFSYLLTAQNVQQAQGSFEIVLPPTMEPTLPQPPKTSSKSPPKTNPPGSSQTTPATKKDVPKNSTMDFRKDHITIVLVVIGLTLFIIVCFISYKCVKRRRAKKEYKAQKAHEALASSTDQYGEPYVVDNTKQAEDYINPSQGRRYGDKPLVPIIITSAPDEFDRTMHTSTVMRSRSFDRPKLSRQHMPKYSYDAGLDEYSQPTVDFSSPVHEISRVGSDQSQDSLRGVPTCKVTPLCDSQESLHNLSRDSTASRQTDNMSRESTTSRATDPVKYDWEKADPELLEHCRKTNPVLHKTKHWV